MLVTPDAASVDETPALSNQRASTLIWTTANDGRKKKVALKAPTLDELLAANIKPRRHLLFPWLREQESCLLYADTGVGKSLFALSAALAIAGAGSFLGWKTESSERSGGWRVLYIDGEMHIGDIQERAAMLLEATPDINQAQAGTNLRFLARQHQKSGAEFPSITETKGMKFYLDQVDTEGLDLVILDNFSTLGEVEDENSASSFNEVTEFLLKLKTANVATMFLHHANKSGESFRGSGKLGATFETIVKLERPKGTTERGEAFFQVKWEKVRNGGPRKRVQEIMATLTEEQTTFSGDASTQWEYEEVDLGRYEEIKEKLKTGDFISQKEVGDYYGVSKPMARKYLDRGVKLGLWSEREWLRWLNKGKEQRKLGNTEAPLRVSPDYDDPDF